MAAVVQAPGRLRERPRDWARIQSADRVLRVLEAIGSTTSGLTAAEVAGVVGLNLSTAYRLLKTLERQEYIARQSDGHRYLLGRTVDALGQALRDQLVATPAVRAVLHGLFAAVRAPAYLTVFHGDDIVVAHIEDSPEHPRIGQLHVGFADAAQTTAFGKLMLAAKDDAEVGRYLERHTPRALTPRSVTDEVRLREQLDEVRAQQLAVEVEEYTRYLACIAAPVKAKSGQTVGAVSVSVSSRDFSGRAVELERAVRRGAWLVSAQLDGDPHRPR